MDVFIRDLNGNTIGYLEDVLPGEGVSAEAHISDAGNLIVTVEADSYDRYDEELREAKRMTADDMRAQPDWSL